MTVIAMSRTEIDRMSVLGSGGEQDQVADAAALMGLARRQVFRLAGLQPTWRGPVSRRRGRLAAHHLRSIIACFTGQ